MPPTSSTEPRRLVNLPGYDDTARDIYETPDLTDDTSTTLTQQTSPRSPSQSSHSSHTSVSDDEGENNQVSRRRLHPSRARSHFHTYSVDTRGGGRRAVDLSDRVDGGRRGYRVRRRGSGDEGEEGLEARIARLRREIEECKVEAESELDFGGRDEEVVGEIEGLGKVLGAIDVKGRRVGQGVQRNGVAGGGEGGARGRDVTPGSWPDVETDGNAEADEEQMLRRVAGFDTRLAALEQALGISALDAVGTEAVTTPILPSLTLLDQQMAALNSAHSLAKLEEASSRIQQLKQEAEQLATIQPQQSQSQSRPSTSASTSSTSAAPGSTSQPNLDDLTKLQSLYTLLPTLQSLSPTIPALLTRLRSLRTLHTSAASAASDLDEVETRQREMERELKVWREGLEKVEEVVREAREANGKNGVVVEGWVRELERRLGKV